VLPVLVGVTGARKRQAPTEYLKLHGGREEKASHFRRCNVLFL